VHGPDLSNSSEHQLGRNWCRKTPVGNNFRKVPGRRSYSIDDGIPAPHKGHTRSAPKILRGRYLITDLSTGCRGKMKFGGRVGNPWVDLITFVRRASKAMNVGVSIVRRRMSVDGGYTSTATPIASFIICETNTVRCNRFFPKRMRVCDCSTDCRGVLRIFYSTRILSVYVLAASSTWEISIASRRKK
jgi:hypothetical protein